MSIGSVRVTLSSSIHLFLTPNIFNDFFLLIFFSYISVYHAGAGLSKDLIILILSVLTINMYTLLTLVPIQLCQA